MYPLFLGKIGMSEILVVLIIVVIFFGGKKIPELMRGLGRGVREFKDAMDKPSEMINGDKASDGSKASADKTEEKK